MSLELGLLITHILKHVLNFNNFVKLGTKSTAASISLVQKGYGLQIRDQKIKIKVDG